MQGSAKLYYFPLIFHPYPTYPQDRSLSQILESSQSQRKSLLLEKRRLQLQVADLTKKREESDVRLNALLKEMEAVEDRRADEAAQAAEGEEDFVTAKQRLVSDVGFWQTKAAKLEAAIHKQTAQEDAPKEREEQISALRDDVARLSTEAELEREQNTALLRKVAELEAQSTDIPIVHDEHTTEPRARMAAPPRGLGDRKHSAHNVSRDTLDEPAEAASLAASSHSQRGAGSAATPNTDREKDKEKIKMLSAMATQPAPQPFTLTAPVFAAASVAVFAFGFLAGSMKGSTPAPAAES